MQCERIQVSTERVEISAIAKKEMDEIELTVEAIEAWIQGFDIKKFDALSQDPHNRFDSTMERILSAVHAQCEWAG